MRRVPALAVAAVLLLGAVAAASEQDTPGAGVDQTPARAPTQASAPASPAPPSAAEAARESLARSRAEIDAETARGVADTAQRARLAEALVQALTAGDVEAAVAYGTRSLAAAREAGTAAERATALNDHAAALDAAGRSVEAKELRAEALALIEREPDAVPVLDRIVFFANLSSIERRAGNGAVATAHALAAAELLLTVDMPTAEADRWTKTLLQFGRDATKDKDPKARDLRIAVIRYASKTGTGEPGSAFKAALDNAVAVCGERPELARDLMLDTIRGPRFGAWLAAHRTKFIEDLDMAGARWGLDGAMASGDEGRRIRRPLLDLLEAAVALVAAPDGSLPPEAEMLLRRALYTGTITHDYARAEAAGLKAVALLEAQPKRDGKALADVYADLGELYLDTDRLEEARAILTRAKATAQEAGDRNAMRSALSSLASLERKVGTPATTLAAYDALLAVLDPGGSETEGAEHPLKAALAKQLGVEAAHTWIARSLALEELGRSDEAGFGYRRSLEISKRAGDSMTFAVNAVYLAQHHLHLGRPNEALALADDVVAQVGRDVCPPMLLSVKANALVNKARRLPPGADRDEALADAVELVELIQTRLADLGDLAEMERADDLRLLAEIERIRSRPESAAALYETLIAHERAQTPPRPARLSLFLLDRAVLSIETGRPAAALADLDEAEALSPAREGDALSAAARASTVSIKAQALGRLDRPAEALETSRRAAALARDVVVAAEDGRYASSEETRRSMAKVFQTAVRSAWGARPAPGR